MEINELYRLYCNNPSVETDTRKIKQADIFFALKGPNFNGNQYAQAALDAGASYCVVDEMTGIVDNRIIQVENSLQTLQQLAKKHRMQFDIPFIAITGSNGKTTTKELIHAVLSSAFKTYTTEGNLNNHIGVPLTILKIKMDAAFAVVEMGANHLGEIASYCDYAMPTHGLITNCGKAHLEGFGSEDAIKKAKGELFDYLRQYGGAAFVFWDYEYLQEMSKGIQHIIKYSTVEKTAEYAGQVKNHSEYLEVNIAKGTSIKEIRTHLVGGYNLPNVLAAVAIGKTFAIPDELIKSSLEHYLPSNSRSQLIEINTNKIILDAYNANPSSMKVAVENFALMKGTRKVLLLGAMKELGADSIAEHNKLVDLIKKNQWEQVVLVGNDFTDLPAGYLHFNNVEEARDWFKKQDLKNAQVLIKGSRSMQMEKLLE